MRFEVRFTNGYYKLFDTHKYTDVALFETRRECEQAVARRNGVSL